jgi:hypothetical protein
MSSFHAPKIILRTYKHIHVTSENRSKFKKLFGLNKKLNKINQNNKFQKLIHVCIFGNYNSTTSFLLTVTWFSKKL